MLPAEFVAAAHRQLDVAGEDQHRLAPVGGGCLLDPGVGRLDDPTLAKAPERLKPAQEERRADTTMTSTIYGISLRHQQVTPVSTSDLFASPKNAGSARI